MISNHLCFRKKGLEISIFDPMNILRSFYDSEGKVGDEERVASLLHRINYASC